METLPPSKLPTLSAASLIQLICTSFATAVTGLGTITNPDHLKRARNHLFWGSRIGAKVDGVRDERCVDTMFRRSLLSNGLAAPIHQNLAGNHVYCMRLSNHYIGKGKTTYCRIGDLGDKGDLFLSNIRIGTDFDETTGETPLRHQATEVRFVSSNIITVILGQDNSTFEEWFCGEPEKIYDESNWRELVDARGRLDLSKVWIQLGVDYNQRSRERKRRVNDRARHEQHMEPKRPHVSAPLNSVSTAFDQALDAAVQAPDEQVELEAPANEAIPAVS